MKKLRSSSGETLIESLLSILILTMAVACLATSVAVTATINANIDSDDLDFSYAGNTGTVGTARVNGVEVSINVYQNNGYYYYEYYEPIE